MENEIKKLKNEIKELKNTNLTNKIFEVIQDINSIYNLENNIDYPINNYFKILRNNRNNHCHYIKKMIIITLKILNLSDERKI